MANHYSMNQQSKKLSRILVAITLTVIAALIIWACAVSLENRTREVPEKAELSARIETGYPEGAKSVAEAFQIWGFPSFNKTAVYSVEACYHRYYYKELPSNDALATAAADLFIEKYFDNIDLTDKDAVTHALANSYISAVGDKYGVYRNRQEQQSYSDNLAGELVGIGVMVSQSEDGLILINSPISGSPAEAAGIKANDIIIAVDGTPVSRVGYNSAADMISGQAGTTVVIRVLRGNEELDFSIVRAKIQEVAVTYDMLDGNIGYISISRFIEPTAEQFIKAIDALEKAGARGIIFDLRNNPGGLLSSVVSTLSYIAKSGTELVSFSGSNAPMYATDGEAPELTDHVYTLPSVVLVNKSTASAGELFTAAMRDFSDAGLLTVTVMGQTTYGKGVMQSGVSFSDGSALTLTTDTYNPPCGINYDGDGIIPDVSLELTEDHISRALLEIARLLGDESNSGIAA